MSRRILIIRGYLGQDSFRYETSNNTDTEFIDHKIK